ncbi:MAG: YeeE/YedE thiosulfate transporter family protein [Myxococcota bacterium]
MDVDLVSSAIGGGLIGLATSLLLFANERVAGISGILAGALWPEVGEKRGWRVAFLSGLPLGALLVSQLRGPLVIEVAAGPWVLVLAGILVGFGTRLANGCTSGHGICGISRGSARSLAATTTFLGVGALTVWIVRVLVEGRSG